MVHARLKEDTVYTIQENKQKERVPQWVIELGITGYPPPIKSVVVNKKARVICVYFVDGDKRVVKCHKTDRWDVSVGVSLAITKHLYGTTTAFIASYAQKIKEVIQPVKSKKK